MPAPPMTVPPISSARGEKRSAMRPAMNVATADTTM